MNHEPHTKAFELLLRLKANSLGLEMWDNAFAVARSMGYVDLKSMEPYQHQELEPLREIIHQRNQRKKFGQVLENEGNKAIGALLASYR